MKSNRETYNALLTVAEAAAILKLHPKTVRRMAKRKLIPSIQFGHAWRFPHTLQQWLVDQMAQHARIPRAWDK